MESLRRFAAILHQHNGPLAGQQVTKWNSQDLVAPFGVGTRGELQTGGFVDAQGTYLDVGKSKVVGVLNRTINVRKITVEFALGSG